MIVNFNNISEPILVVSENLPYKRIYENQQAKFSIHGDEFIQLINTRNRYYILVPKALIRITASEWDAGDHGLADRITCSAIWQALSDSARVQNHTLFGFHNLEDAVMFKLTWL